MSTAALVNALALPPNARFAQRVHRKLLLEQGATAAANTGRVSLADEMKGGAP